MKWILVPKILLPAILLSITSVFISWGEKKEDINALKNTLINLEKKSWDAWQQHDAKFYSQFLSSDHKEVGAGGVAGKKDVVELVGSGLCKVSSYSTDQFSFAMIDENVAVLTYHASQETVCNNKVPSPVWVASIYVKRKGHWENVVYQQSVAQK